MAKLSAGILAYRHHKDGLQVLLVHPGGPFFKNQDEGVWSMPKGEYIEGEDALAAAKREFIEETGNTITGGSFRPLTPIKIKSGKVISAWAIECELDQPFITSNLFEMEWPPRSGKKQSFPEVDNAAWYSLEEAKSKISPGQIPFLEELPLILGK